MEIRISRILSEYYDYTRKESEEFIRQGRVTLNGEKVNVGDKATLNDVVELDSVRVPLKGIFKKVKQEQAGHAQDSFRELRGEGSPHRPHTDPMDKRGRTSKKSPKKESFDKRKSRRPFEDE